MPTVVGVKLRFNPKVLWFDPADADVEEGDHVVVETERGHEFGEVTRAPFEVEESDLPAPLKPLLRRAGVEDYSRVEELEAKEREAMPVFRRLIEERELDMKPAGVEFLFDGDKIVFYFSAEERVDFRELVRDLATRFHARIDMRQIGVRDEARMVGGVGHCGQKLCCVRFSGDFQPVSIRMAKEQDLPLKPLKISGLCGRLMCCLRYEYDAYQDFKSRAPKRGSVVETPLGLAKVVDLNTPREVVGLRLEDGERLSVRLDAMECSKDSGCPCSVSREALEAIAPSAVAVAAPAREVAEKTPGPSAGGERKKRRSRRPSEGGGGKAKTGSDKGAAGDRTGGPEGGTKKGKSGKTSSGGKGGDKSRQEQKAQTSDKAQEGSGGSSKSRSGGRRRRRRRPSGGGDSPKA